MLRPKQDCIQRLLDPPGQGHDPLDPLQNNVAHPHPDPVLRVDLGRQYPGAEGGEHIHGAEPLRVALGVVEHHRLVANRVGGPGGQGRPQKGLLFGGHHVVGVHQPRLALERDQPRLCEAELQPPRQQIQHGGGHWVPVPWEALVAEVGHKSLQPLLVQEGADHAL